MARLRTSGCTEDRSKYIWHLKSRSRFRTRSGQRVAGGLHLDLKCPNIILIGGDKPRPAVIADFGLARSFPVSRPQTLINLAQAVTAGPPFSGTILRVSNPSRSAAR